MESYLDSTQVADHLGITVDALAARIQAGEFPRPDVIVGELHEGWARGTLDRWQAPTRHEICCKSGDVARIITGIRVAAEDIRGYGSRPGSPGISVVVPRELYALTSLIESELRRLVTIDHWMATSFGEEISEADVGRIDFDLPPAASLAIHPNLNLALGESNLRRAANELEALAGQLRSALISGPSRGFSDTLLAQADIVRAYAKSSAAT